MNSKMQVSEDYKFRFAYIIDLIKEMVSASGELEDKELNAKIEDIKKKQDGNYIASLEKDIETHDITKKRKTTRNSENGIKNNIPVKEERRSINSGITLDEEKEL